MKRLILVRYGLYENGSLTSEGEEMMRASAEKIRTLANGSSMMVVSADVPRARESAMIIADTLSLPFGGTYAELYADDQAGNMPNPEQALSMLENIGKDTDVIIAVTSREYIATLPVLVARTYFDKETDQKHLDRGEVLLIDLVNKIVV